MTRHSFRSLSVIHLALTAAANSGRETETGDSPAWLTKATASTDTEKIRNQNECEGVVYKREGKWPDDVEVDGFYRLWMFGTVFIHSQLRADVKWRHPLVVFDTPRCG